MQIKLEHIYYNDIKLKVKSLDKKVTEKLKTKLKFESSLKRDISVKNFSINFDISISNKDFNLLVKSEAVFLTDKELSDNFIDSAFCNINAPAIAFPYIRAYISNFTLNSGYDPIMLPSFNFVQIHQDKVV